MSAMYYLISQCEIEGSWQAKDWLYFSQLNNYYRNMLPTLSILMSTSDSCENVYPTIYEQCTRYYADKGQKAFCNYHDIKR